MRRFFVSSSRVASTWSLARVGAVEHEERNVFFTAVRSLGASAASEARERVVEVCRGSRRRSCVGTKTHNVSHICTLLDFYFTLI